MAHRVLIGSSRVVRLLAAGSRRASALAPTAPRCSAIAYGSTVRAIGSGLSPLTRVQPQQQQGRLASSSMATRAAPVGVVDPMRAATYPFEPEVIPNVAVASDGVQSWAGDLLLIAVSDGHFAKDGENVKIASNVLKALDADFGGAIADIVAEGGFEGKKGSQTKAVRVGTAPGAKAKMVALVGLGDGAKAAEPSKWGNGPYHALGAAAASLTKANKAASAAIAFADAPAGDAGSMVQQLVTGLLTSAYESTRFKSKPSPTVSKLSALTLLIPGVDADAAVAPLMRARAYSAGNMVARYLVEAPPNICTPSHIAACAAHIAAKFPGVMSLRVLERAECAELGMGAFLGVAEASEEPPKFIHLTYTPPGGAKDGKKLALVGKGLTFDSGGYNLKAGAGSMIEMMKFDMGGSGAVIGAARAIAELQPEGAEVHFVVASCENMVAGKGLRPGDILKSAAGKTIEVNNTDAEGRLTLADALWYAQEKCGVTTIVDIATLTGATYVALGPSIAGYLSDSEELSDGLMQASRASGEKLWRLPMEETYWDFMKSPVADMKNTGSRWGGAITAALFLKQYINEGVTWAHIDMAGPAWDDKANQATGFGAMCLTEWVAAQK